MLSSRSRRPQSSSLGPFSSPYSPECVEEEFSEVGYPRAIPKQLQKSLIWVIDLLLYWRKLLILGPKPWLLPLVEEEQAK